MTLIAQLKNESLLTVQGSFIKRQKLLGFTACLQNCNVKVETHSHFCLLCSLLEHLDLRTSGVSDEEESAIADMLQSRLQERNLKK